MTDEDKIKKDFREFLRYALYELMLPHHFSKYENKWMMDRVSGRAQQLLNKYDWKQIPPEETELLVNSTYWRDYQERQQKQKNRSMWQKFKDYLKYHF